MESDLRRDCCRRILHRGRTVFPLVDDARAVQSCRYLKSWTALNNWANVPGEFEHKLLARTTLLQY